MTPMATSVSGHPSPDTKITISQQHNKYTGTYFITLKFLDGASDISLFVTKDHLRGLRNKIDAFLEATK